MQQLVTFSLNRGVWEGPIWKFSPGCVFSLRPGESVGTRAVEYMASQALGRGWKGKKWVLADPVDMQQFWVDLNKNNNARPLQKWSECVNLFAMGPDSRLAVIHPVHKKAHWSLLMVFHPGLTSQWCTYDYLGMRVDVTRLAWAGAMIWHPFLAGRLHRWVHGHREVRDAMASAGEYTIILHVDSLGYKSHNTEELTSEWIKALAHQVGADIDEVKPAVKVYAVSCAPLQ